MASLVCICSGWVGLKSENVEKVFVLQHFLKGQGSPEDSNRTNNGARNRKKERKKESPSPRPPISYPASAGFIGIFILEIFNF